MYLSIRDDTVFGAGYQTLAEGLRDLNIEGVELSVRRDDTVPALAPKGGKARLKLTDPAELAELQAQARAAGARISALCMGNDFNAADKAAEVAWAARTVRAAQQLGAPAVRIDAIMHGEHDLPLEERRKIVAGMIRQILEQTADTGVDLGIENHGYQGNDPAFLRGLLQDVRSPRLGLTLDSGNFYWRGWPLSTVYAIFEEFAPAVKHTHIKNIAYPPELRETQREIGYAYDRYVSPIHEGDIDHARYFAALTAAGYERDLCLEDESLG
ncbi:MAG TPA: TIM barrel protein, partial [Chthonomonadaceae bacterium]|nr:TIM barrel protein [Chthonomonadaceae bacterium]